MALPVNVPMQYDDDRNDKHASEAALIKLSAQLTQAAKRRVAHVFEKLSQFQYASVWDLSTVETGRNSYWTSLTSDFNQQGTSTALSQSLSVSLNHSQVGYRLEQM